MSQLSLQQYLGAEAIPDPEGTDIFLSVGPQFKTQVFGLAEVGPLKVTLLHWELDWQLD